MKDQQFPKEIHKDAVLSIVHDMANLPSALNIFGKNDNQNKYSKRQCV